MNGPFFMEENMFEQFMQEWSERLILHEGMRLMPYRCTRGKLTIGVGRNLEDNPLTVDEQRALGDFMHGITANGAKMLLRNDMVRCLKLLLRHIKGFDKLTPDRQYALLDMCFQLGWKGLCQFKKMLAAMEKEDFDKAYRECLYSAYAKQTPVRARRIARLIRGDDWKEQTK